MDHLVWNSQYAEEAAAAVGSVAGRCEQIFHNLETIGSALRAMCDQGKSETLERAMREIAVARGRVTSIQEEIRRTQKAVVRADEIFREAERKNARLIDLCATLAAQAASGAETSQPVLIGIVRESSRLEPLISPAWLADAAEEEFSEIFTQ